MYKVFINDSVINFIDSKEKLPKKTKPFEGEEQLLTIIAELEENLSTKHYNIGCVKPNEVWEMFQGLYKSIDAAGGVVYNEAGEMLMIFRLGKWDLPKGKIEKNESPDVAAMREVTEECGVQGLKIVKELPSSYHTYRHNGKRVLKRTCWYEMSCNEKGPLIPQTEEQIIKAIWATPEEVEQNKQNTYSSILTVLNQL